VQAGGNTDKVRGGIQEGFRKREVIEKAVAGETKGAEEIRRKEISEGRSEDIDAKNH